MKLRQAKKIYAAIPLDGTRPRHRDDQLGRAYRRIKRTKSEKELEQWWQENIVPLAPVYNMYVAERAAWLKRMTDFAIEVFERNKLPPSMLRAVGDDGTND